MTEVEQLRAEVKRLQEEDEAGNKIIAALRRESRTWEEMYKIAKRDAEKYMEKSEAWKLKYFEVEVKY